jgi:uncharacterized protein (TIGR02996 family)
MSRDSFLRTIRERPEDDGPRLVYADWLEEQGDPRGEFIRIQCELARLPPWDPRRPALEEREADLLAVHDCEWLGQPLSPIIDWTFRRGFVERFTVTRLRPAGWLDTVRESVRPSVAFALAHPQQLGGESMRDLTDVAHLEELGGIDWLEPVPREEDRSLATLLQSPRLQNLRRLAIRGDAAGDTILNVLNSRPGADRLTDLELNNLSADGVDHFFRCVGLNNIDSMAFVGGVTRTFAHEIGQAPFRWRKLDLGPRGFRHADLTGLTDCRNLAEVFLTWVSDLTTPLPLPPALKRLHLNWGEAGALPPALPRLSVLPQLEWLYLRVDAEEPLGHGHEIATLEEVLRRLRGPILHFVAIRHGLTFRNLARLPEKNRFRRLVFHCDVATDPAVKSLAEQGGFTSLQSFNLRCPQLTSRHLEALSQMPFPPSLRRLTINSHLADDAGVATLLRSPHLQRLTYINLRECHVGPVTWAALAESPGLPRLREVILPIGGELDDQDIRQLSQLPGASPLLRLHRR